MTTPTQADLDANITRLPRQRMEMKSVVIALGDCPACRQPITGSADISLEVFVTAVASGGWKADAPAGAPKSPPLTVGFEGVAATEPVVDRFGITHRCGGRIEAGDPA